MEQHFTAWGRWYVLRQCFLSLIMSWHAEKSIVFVKHIWANRGSSFSLKASDLGVSTAFSLAQLRPEGGVHSLSSCNMLRKVHTEVPGHTVGLMTTDKATWLK